MGLVTGGNPNKNQMVRKLKGMWNFLRGDQHGSMERGHHLKNLVQKKKALEFHVCFGSFLEII